MVLPLGVRKRKRTGTEKKVSNKKVTFHKHSSSWADGRARSGIFNPYVGPGRYGLNGTPRQQRCSFGQVSVEQQATAQREQESGDGVNIVCLRVGLMDVKREKLSLLLSATNTREYCCGSQGQKSFGATGETTKRPGVMAGDCVLVSTLPQTHMLD